MLPIELIEWAGADDRNAAEGQVLPRAEAVQPIAGWGYLKRKLGMKVPVLKLRDYVLSDQCNDFPLRACEAAARSGRDFLL